MIVMQTTIHTYHELNEFVEQLYKKAEKELPKTQKNNRTGHKFISLQPPNYYRVQVKGKYIGIFKSLDEAIKKRDEYLKENNIEI